MRSRWNLPIFAGYAVGCLLVAVFLVVQMSGSGLFQPTYRFTAVLKSASDLVPGDDVTLSGIRVGHIDSLMPGENGTVAQLELMKDYAPLYNDSRAVVKSKNLLGERYLEINRGTPGAGTMPDGGTIPMDRTLTPVEVSQVLDALTPDVRDQLTIAINSLGEGVAGQGPNMNASAGDLRVLAQGLQRIADELAANSTDLDSMITALRKVMDTLAAWHAQFRQLIANWDSLMRELASREQQFKGTLVEQDRVMAILNQAFAGGADQSLHNAIASAPGTLNSAEAYVGQGDVVFPAIANETVDITRLFYELASVMSYNDPTTGHHWRVYTVVNCSDAGVLPPVPASPPPGYFGPTSCSVPKVGGGTTP